MSGNGNGNGGSLPPEVDLTQAENAGQAIFLLHEEIKATREAVIRLSHRLEASDAIHRGLDSVIRGQTHAIEQCSAVASQAAVHSRLAQVTADAVLERIDRQAIEDADRWAAVMSELAAIRKDIGQVPVVFDTRMSVPGQHTPEELSAMEKGTGLRGEVSALAASHSRLVKQVFAAGGGGLTLGAALAKLMELTSSNDAWAPTLVPVLVLLLASFAAMAWKRRHDVNTRPR